MKRITKTAVLILSALMLFGCADSSVDAKPPVTVASPSSTSEALPEKPASSITDIMLYSEHYYLRGKIFCR